MKFIDLFAGLGGFHQALSKLGHNCVFASELQPELAALYERNFNFAPHGDIRKINPILIPEHDVLCAGFPCQPFSKAGHQNGLECPQWGNLINYVVRILKAKRPEFFIVENVPNLVRHNGGETWAAIINKLEKAGYAVDDANLSPHMFGVPQIRERAFIVGRRGGLKSFSWPTGIADAALSINSVLDSYPDEARLLSAQQLSYLETWQAFIQAFPADLNLPSFPIWSMEFGATYPYENHTPHEIGYSNLRKYRGAFGKTLAGLTPKQCRESLPTYALEPRKAFPAWKVDFITKNRQFYRQHKDMIDPWLARVKTFPASFQKLEWNCKEGGRDIWQYVLQFRASGIRVKKPTSAPSLVAMTSSQVPIIGWEKRYMTPRECSRLQSMGSLAHLPDLASRAYKALGNAINVSVVEAIAHALLDHPSLEMQLSTPVKNNGLTIKNFHRKAA